MSEKKSQSKLSQMENIPDYLDHTIDWVKYTIDWGSKIIYGSFLFLAFQSPM